MESQTSNPSFEQHAESDRPTNRCVLWHRMHTYDLFYGMGTGIYTRKCTNCGITEAEVKAQQSDGSQRAD